MWHRRGDRPGVAADSDSPALHHVASSRRHRVPALVISCSSSILLVCRASPASTTTAFALLFSALLCSHHFLFPTFLQTLALSLDSQSALMIADGAVAALERDLTALKLRLAASKAARARINGGNEGLDSGGNSGGNSGGGGSGAGVDSDSATRDAGSNTPDSWPQARRLHM